MAEEEKKVTLEEVGVPVKEKESQVVIGRIGSAPVNVTVTGKATIADALSKAGVKLSSTESVWLGGERATLMTPITTESATISIFSPKQAGNK